jgi:peptidyl-tRNA hydrolase, PTH2 family
MTTKQVIVMRTDLNMRKGKMIAQGAHASIAWLTRGLREGGLLMKGLSLAEQDWLDHSFTKVCVRVDSEQALLKVMDDADLWKIHCYPIVDNGSTEFHGVPTLTCCSIGPDWSDMVDKVTGHLALL